MHRPVPILWPNVRHWTPVPLNLILHASELLSDPLRPAHRIPQRLAVVLTIIARGYTHDSWPVIPLSWRALTHATGLSRSTLHSIASELEALDILIRHDRPGPMSVNRWDLSPLQSRLEAMDAIARPSRAHTPPVQPVLLDVPDHALTARTIDDVVTRAALSAATTLGKNPRARVRARSI